MHVTITNYFYVNQYKDTRQRWSKTLLKKTDIFLFFSDYDDLSGLDSRPSSQRSKKTLRQVSSLLFIATPTSSGKKKLEDLDSSTLVDLIKDYMIENEDLRRENYELLTVRAMIMRDQEMVCLENEKLIKKVEECEQFHSFGGKSKVSDLVRHRRNGSNTSLPEMINNNNLKQVHYDSSSAVSS